MNEALTILEQSFNVLLQSPAWLLLLIVLNLLGAYLQWSNWCPNKLIPAILVVIGIVAYSFLGSRGSVSPEQPHPQVVLGMIGFILGAAAWLLHGTLLQYLAKKFNLFPDANGARSIAPPGPAPANLPNPTDPTPTKSNP